MARRRAGISFAIGITLVMALVSGGVFAFQYTTAYAQCSALPGPSPCASVAPSQIALDTAFIALFGLLAAIVISVSAGVNWQGLSIPDPGLANRMEKEEREYARQQALVEQQAQQQALNIAREQARQFAATQAAAMTPAAAEVAGLAGAAGAGLAAAGAGSPQVTEVAPGTGAGAPAPEPEVVLEWHLEEDEPRPETIDDARRRVLETRLKNLAKRKPEAVAEVLQGWIESSPTGMGGG